MLRTPRSRSRHHRLILIHMPPEQQDTPHILRLQRRVVTRATRPMTRMAAVVAMVQPLRLPHAATAAAVTMRNR